MIDFWLAAGLLLLVALAFLLIPVLRGRKARPKGSHRTQRRPVPGAPGRTPGPALRRPPRSSSRPAVPKPRVSCWPTPRAPTPAAARAWARPCRSLPRWPCRCWASACTWGASDKVELAREMREQPRTIEDDRAPGEGRAGAAGFRRRLVFPRPYLHGPGACRRCRQGLRARRAVAGRQPELLGQWAQALYFASQKRFTPRCRR